jgi:putative ABC transport system ATP-binding protein
MLQMHSGEVFVRGRPSSVLSDSERAALRARQYGFVFQDSALDSTRTVIDNIVETTLYRGGSRKDDVNRALQLMQELGVDVPADRKPGQVSGGQAQRIALCRALLNEPSILLADEPTGNLDLSTATVVIDAMRRHADCGATVIVVTHSSHLADACDREIKL